MKIDVAHVAKLANLPLSSSEKSKFEKQLEETAKHVESLGEVKTENIEPTNQVTGLQNIVRDDTTNSERMLSQDEALSNTSSKQNGLFKVKGVLNEG